MSFASNLRTGRAQLLFMAFLLLLAAACGSDGSVGNMPQGDATTKADATSPDGSDSNA